MDTEFVTPTFADWQAKAPSLGLKERSGQLSGACPGCRDGDDRFWVKRDGTFGCRICKPGKNNVEAFKTILVNAGFAEERQPPRRKKRHRYPYHDAAGRLVVTTVVNRDAITGKKISTPRPDPIGAVRPPDGWPLYRLADFESESPFLLVEGEHTVEAARKLVGDDYIVTTTYGGANRVGQADLSSLEDRAGIVWPDADKAGRIYATKFAERAYEAGAVEVRIVDTHDLPDKWDLADTPPPGVDIRDRLENSRLSSPIGIQKDDETFVPTMAEFLVADLTPPEWLLYEMIPAAGVSFLSAKPDVGKTTFERMFAYCVSRGESFMGRATKQGPVFLGLFEEDASFNRDFLVKLGVTADDPIYPFIRPVPDDLFVQLSDWVMEIRPALVILDTFHKVIPGVDLNEYDQVNRAITPYVNLARTAKTCILFSHHNRKAEGGDPGDELLGSTAIRGNTDTTMIMRMEGQSRVIETTQRYGKNLPATYLRMDEATGRIEVDGEKRERRRDEVREAIVTYVRENEPVKKSKIENDVKGSAKMIRALLDELCRDGELRSWKRGNAIMYATHD